MSLCLLAGCPAGDKPKDEPTRIDAGAAEPAEDEDEPQTRADAGTSSPGTPKPSSPAGSGAAGAGGAPSSTPDSKPRAPSAGGSPAPQPSAAAPFFLPTLEPTNTTSPHLLRDASGASHALYPRYAGGGAFYAYCNAETCSERDWQAVRIDTDGSVTNAALALTREGKPRALLSTSLRVYYAQCDDGCTQSQNWTTSVIVDHQGAQDVTGQALAIDAQGRPRFLMHTYLAYLGVGQKTPRTWFSQCDAGCNDPASWRHDQVSDLILYGSQLLFDSAGRARLLTGIENVDGKTAGFKQAAYFECDADCGSSDAWNGLGLVPLYENSVKEIPVSLSLALTRSEQPRVVLLARDETFQPHLMYLACDDSCVEDHWRVSTLSDSMRLGPGLDLELDGKDRPRFALTLEDSIGLYTCNDADCAADGANWTLNKVEAATEVPPDSIILWWNCTVDAWILHSPSLALGRDGQAQVAYVATDLSGGVSTPNPTKPRCDPGKDMTLTRTTTLASYK